MKGDIMTGSEILDLLKYGGKRTLHLPIPVEV